MAFLAPLAIAGAAAGGSSLLGASTLTALTLGTAALTGVNAIQQGHYNAAVARNNATIAEQNAARISEASQREALRSDQDYRALLAEQLAAQGASGFDILGRSQRSVRMLTTRTGRRAAVDIRQEGEAGARQSIQEATDFRNQDRQSVRQGYITAAGEVINAGTGLMKSGSLIGRRRRMPWDRRPTGASR